MSSTPTPRIDARGTKSAAIGRWTFERALLTIQHHFDDGDVSPGETRRALDYLNQTFLKVGDVQRILGIKSPTTIKKWISQGVFPGSYQPNGHWLIPARRVFDFRDASLRAQRMNAEKKLSQQVATEDDLFRDLGI